MLHSLTGHTGAIRWVAWSPDGTHLATAASAGTARIWDTTTGTTRHILTGHTGAVGSVAWSPDGTHLTTTADDRTARIWDGATGRPAGPQISLLPAVRSPSSTAPPAPSPAPPTVPGAGSAGPSSRTVA